MTTLADALDYARSARTQCDEPSLPDLQIIALAEEVERLRPFEKRARAYLAGHPYPGVDEFQHGAIVLAQSILGLPLGYDVSPATTGEHPH